MKSPSEIARQIMYLTNENKELRTRQERLVEILDKALDVIHGEFCSSRCYGTHIHLLELKEQVLKEIK